MGVPMSLEPKIYETYQLIRLNNKEHEGKMKKKILVTCCMLKHTKPQKNSAFFNKILSDGTEQSTLLTLI